MAHQRPMVSGAKFGLVFVCVFMLFILLLIWQPDPVRQVFRRIPDQVGYLLLFGQPVLIGVAGLITGIQKGRPGIGLLALLLIIGGGQEPSQNRRFLSQPGRSEDVPVRCPVARSA